MIREFEGNPLAVPKFLLTGKKGGPDQVGSHVPGRESPLGGKTIQDLNDRHVPQGGNRTDGDGSVLFHPAPSHQVILYSPNIVSCCSMAYLVHLEPFGIVVEKMKGASGMLAVPQ